jgi:drug/metabolite transporter (DMT)-like permease
MLLLSVCCYGSGAFLMTRLLSKESLGVTYAINNVGQVALLLMVGVLVFNERLTLFQGCGAVLAILAVVLMALPGRIH